MNFQWLRSKWQAYPDRVLSFGVFTATLGLLISTSGQGFVRDEGYYFRAAEQYFHWFESLARAIGSGDPARVFSDRALVHAFGYNNEHPGFVKILMGITHALFHRFLGWTSSATGFRLGAMAMVASGAAALYLFGSRRFGRLEGFLAVVCLFSMPHVFYHAHLACFDGPIMAAQLIATYLFWRAASQQRWGIAAGVAFGVALATKHNAVFLLPTLLAAYAWASRDQAEGQFAWLRLPRVALSLMSIGPLVLYVFYPYGWLAPVERIGAYYRYHANHEHYPVDWFGTMLYEPPFPISYPFVMSGITIPLPLLAAGILGLSWTVLGVLERTGRSQNDRLGDALIVLGVAVPMVLIAWPTTPIFGGTKHWMTAMPFLALAAARCIAVAARALGAVSRWAPVPFVAGVVALPISDVVVSYPLGHTYYNEAIGGVSGAAMARLPRTFWGGDGRALLARLNGVAPKGAHVFTDRMNRSDFVAYQRDRLLRPDLRQAFDIEPADFVLLNHQREFADHEARVHARDGRIVDSLVRDGVSIATLYRMEKTSIASALRQSME